MYARVPIPPCPDAKLARFLAAAERVLPEHFEADSCLNSTRVALDVLRALRISAHPLSVDFTIWNAVWANKYAEKNGPPDSEEEAQAWVAAGGWAAKVDTVERPSDPGMYPGHVVCHARGYLIDLTVRQFVRPERQILLPDVWALPLVEGFLDAEAPVFTQAHDGSVAFYRARLGDRRYLDPPSGFMPSEKNRRASQAVYAEYLRLESERLLARRRA